jgi:hypothetical protein
MASRRARATGVLAAAIVLAGPATALGAHPVRGAVYIGHLFKGALGTVTFRVSADGKTMRFQGRAAFTVTCHNAKGQFTGGGEALLVSEGPQASEMLAPVVNIAANGTFSGAGSRTFKPTSAPLETLHYRIGGRFTGTGSSAVGTLTRDGCVSRPFSLSKR